MKNKFYLLLFIIFGMVRLSGQNNIGEFGAAVRIQSKSGTQYYDLYPAKGIGSIQFDGYNAGTYSQHSDSLVIRGAQLKTWKHYLAGNICSATMYYTVYPAGSRPADPVFTAMGIPWKDNCNSSAGSFPSGGPCSSPTDQKWSNENSAVDLTNYPAGTYTLEAYMQYQGSDTSGSSCNDNTEYVGNSGANYKMSFIIAAPNANTFYNPATGTVAMAGAVPSDSALGIPATASSGVNENYIETTEYLSPDQSQKKIGITFYDGLGRPKQEVAVGATPKGNDIVTPVEYDGFGRQVRDWLPLPQSGTAGGNIYASPDTSQAAALYGDNLLYAEKQLEDSPLDRLLQQAHPGTPWALGSGHTQQFSYDTNVAGEVRRYTATTSWNASDADFDASLAASGDASDTNAGYYNAATLYKNTMTDEDGNTSIEFKNGMGQAILVRKILNGGNVDTYYVYDDLGHLAFVIPPLASTGATDAATLDALCYRYIYDSRGRLSKKKLPGKDWELMVYDLQDRLAATQDGNLRAAGQWLFTKYDQFGRVAYTGISSGAQSRGPEQAAAEGMAANNVVYSTSAQFSKNGRAVFYTNQDNTYPASGNIATLLTEHFYDNYPPDMPSGIMPSQILSQNVIPSGSSSSAQTTQGMPVATYVKDIEDDDWTLDYTFYDNKGRSVGSYSQNHLGGYTQVQQALNFPGSPVAVNTAHLRSNNGTDKAVSVAEQFLYDNQNRLLKHYHSVDGAPQELLSSNSYDEALRLQNKQVGNNLQQIDYSYNVRGWMTGINLDAGGNMEAGKLFNMALRYQNPANASLAPARYNGNISETDWATAGDGVLRRYGYQYDNLSRLLQATYQKPNSSVVTTHAYDESAVYDLNGNILQLNRYGDSDGVQAVQIDNLQYSYSGNRLSSVSDASGNYSGYPGGGNTITYDANGNMASQKDEGLSQISYNYLNLPHYATTAPAHRPGTGTIVSGYSSTAYTYSAGGEKLQKNYTRVIDGLNYGILTQYLDGFQYVSQSSGMSPVAADTDAASSDLQFFPTAEGYYDYQSSRYVYNYTDQLGNVRVSYHRDTVSGNPVVDQENNYYPFGLQHSGYNSISSTPAYNYKYQGQELQESGFYSFKWRNYDPSIGRFLSIDPLGEKYAYQSHYNFSENRVVNARELEGLEAVFFQSVLNKDVRFQKAYQAERQTSGGREFYHNLKSQNLVNVLYTNFTKGATGISKLIESNAQFDELSKEYGLGVSSKEYHKISENGTKKVQIIGISYPDEKKPVFDVAATLNHEEVAHASSDLKGEDKTNAEGHKEYYGEYREASPEDKDVLMNSKYGGTKAQDNLNQLEKIIQNKKIENEKK